MAPQSPEIRVFDCFIARPHGGTYEYLLLKRAPDRKYAGDWRMVGGKMDPGETAWRACLREIAEETSLPVEKLYVVPYINQFYEWEYDRINAIPVFVAITRQGQDPVLDAEHDAFAWLALDDATGRLPWPGQRAGLMAAHQLLTQGQSLPPYMQVLWTPKT